MRHGIALAAIGLGLSLAQTQIPTFPICAFSCDNTGTQNGCLYGDYNCYCRAPAANAIVACVKAACSKSDLDDWEVWAKDICGPFGGGQFGTTTSSSASSTPTSGSAATPNAQSPSSNDQSNNMGTTSAAPSSGSGVAPGVIAGAVVGGVVFLAIVAIVIFLLWRRGNRHKRQSALRVDHANVPMSNALPPPVAAAAGTGNVDGRLEFGAGVEDSHTSDPGKVPEINSFELHSDHGRTS